MIQKNHVRWNDPWAAAVVQALGFPIVESAAGTSHVTHGSAGLSGSTDSKDLDEAYFGAIVSYSRVTLAVLAANAVVSKTNA